MDCLSPEELVSYVRGGGVDSRAVEAHVGDCPGCAMELLLVRETLGELRTKAARPGTDRLRRAPRKRSAAWIPWAVAASLLLAALIFAVASQRPAPEPVVVKIHDPVRPKPPAPSPSEIPPPPPEPPPKLQVPTPLPEPPRPRSEPRPEPLPEKAPEPVKSPVPPVPPAPEPQPQKPATTVVEKPVVARVVHSAGGTAPPVGRTFRAGETITTARQEYLEVALEGYGHLFFRENSQADLGASGDVTLHEGEMLAKVEPGRKWGSLKLAVAQVEPLAPVFNVLATKTSAEVSILDGRIASGAVSAKGPATMLVRVGKAPEIRALDPGFASWIPDRLVSKRFTGWFEAEDFSSLQGFRASLYEGTSGGKAVVQVAEQGAVGTKLALPFKGRHVVWLRARQYEAKPALIGIHLNSQPSVEVKLEWMDGKAWRWVGPLIVNSDRLDLGITALSRWPLKEGEATRSFPVVLDTVVISSDLKFVPPEKLTEEGRGAGLRRAGGQIERKSRAICRHSDGQDSAPSPGAATYRGR